MTTTASIDVSERAASSGVTARLFSIAVLTALLGGAAWVGREAYQALTDSFVAPMILSPDNDLVIQTKLRMSELALERAKSTAALEALDADIASCEQAIARLEELKQSTSNALEWTKTITDSQSVATAGELAALRKQRAVLAEALANQQTLTDAARENLENGLVSKTDYARELQALNQLHVALLENDRVRMQAQLQQKQVRLARKSLASSHGEAPPMPDVVMRADHMVRIELELLKIEAERRTKAAERRVVAEKLAKIDELDAQLKGRPVVRAAEQSLDLAFVPYTQLDGVQEGARVYDCIWGIFRCKPVGTVAEVVRGEVVLPDPWGTQARGQYAILDLVERDAAKSKTLRVRIASKGESEPSNKKKSFWSAWNAIAGK